MILFKVDLKVIPTIGTTRVITRFAWLPTKVRYRNSHADPRYMIWLEKYQVGQERRAGYWQDKIKYLTERKSGQILSKILREITESLKQEDTGA